MSSEERLDRLEFWSAGFVEERRRERDEDRQLWRDTQRQINELSIRIAETNDAVSRLADEARASIRQLAKETREADRALGQRIDALTAAVAELIHRMNIPPKPGPL